MLLWLGGASASVRIEIDFAKPWRPAPGSEASPIIRPVWKRQNAWMPWKRWDPAAPPRFEQSIGEIALVMATGARPDGEFTVPDLYRDSAGILAPFDPGHPFFRALAILMAQGLRPLVDIGPVPIALCRPDHRTPGVFGWVTDGPVDYEKYYRYIKALFTHLRTAGPFSAEEVDRWGYQLLREPDNGDSWNPRSVAGVSDPGNMLEYEHLYDCTLAGMRDAGVKANLGLGNLVIPNVGSLGAKDAWTAPLISWLASNADNRCPEHLTLPRVRSESDTLDFAFSGYGGEGTQVGKDPRGLESITSAFRLAIRRAFPRNPIRISVGEGNLFSPGLLLRSEGSEMGAAWNAAIFKVAEDAGIHRYVQWGFVSASHVSQFVEHGGLPSASANVVEMYRRMEGKPRAAVQAHRSGLSFSPPYIDGIASHVSPGENQFLIYHYRAERGASVNQSVLVRLRGLQPGRAYGLKHFHVDAGHANYLPALERDLKAKGLSVASADACMEHQFGAAERAVWDANKETYRKLSRLLETKEGLPDSLRADGNGRTEAWIDLPANSVLLVEMRS
ncbi:MAG: hypothetical protein ABIW76_08835 [Fibrobacteria bacterium]